MSFSIWMEPSTTAAGSIRPRCPFSVFSRSEESATPFYPNNSSYSTEQYVAKLQAMGIDAAPEEF